ncbi:MULTISPECIES: hypothetical protein [Paraburkholderia]|uniref:hypothetical protein n=1 Tax=Paraburkholderia TaxID=1822464 RepID=UPI002250A9E3|nr:MULTISPECIES: hypothetical protein [Paraburkholderia]MCX4156984.1 hypothetical protein [Paraburkholderia aspalathi]MDN7166388.1 hypothetical protein [Paraburkholderia sp. SECH2]MDQ6394874.1 hypothetical protein [Paraburkholderia aspalathi]
MKKSAISASVTILLVTVCFRAGAETLPQVILQCSGEQSSVGINAPKDVLVPNRDPNVVGTYTLRGNVLTESGGGTFADELYNLCSTTSTNYVYSTDCSVGRMRYISDWLQVTDAASNDRFMATHKASAYTLDILVIDRVNMSVTSEYLSNQLRTDYDQKNKKVTLTPYLTSIRFVGRCSVVKPKL